MPWFACANVTSLDAVLVGLIWVAIFTYSFCDRAPAMDEAAIIGMSIWLVYTADRLFDSLRLDAAAPHSLRHRFHRDHRRPLAVCWLVVLAIDVTTMIRGANDSQLRWGLAAAGLVIGYVAAAQLWRTLDRWLPKEIQIGLVFAFGTSLVAWSEPRRAESMELLIANGLAAMLFTLNCLAVGIAERELDDQQGFDSLVRRVNAALRRWFAVAVAHGLLTGALLWLHLVPELVAGCLIAGDVLLIAVMWIAARRDTRSLSSQAGSVRFRWPVVFADLALVAPALVVPALAWWGGGTGLW